MPIRIFLVDDHHLVREGVACLLAREPDVEVVGTASNGREALSAMAAAGPDLVLCDVLMPQLNGVDATRRIREFDPSIKVLALAEQSDPESVSRMIRAGACGYVVKASPYEELIAAIRAVISGENFLSPSVAGGLVREYVRRCADGRGREAPLLTEREREVLQLVAEGNRTKDIAETLGLSVKTIENHRKALMTKLGVASVAELTKYAVRSGLTTLET